MVFNPALPDNDFDEAVEIARGEFERGETRCRFRFPLHLFRQVRGWGIHVITNCVLCSRIFGHDVHRHRHVGTTLLAKMGTITDSTGGSPVARKHDNARRDSFLNQRGTANFFRQNCSRSNVVGTFERCIMLCIPPAGDVTGCETASRIWTDLEPKSPVRRSAITNFGMPGLPPGWQGKLAALLGGSGLL